MNDNFDKLKKLNTLQSNNIDKLLKEISKINTLTNSKPTLLIHSCCAPCSSYVLEYLNEYFSITVLYYNPNISPKEEYTQRANEQQRLILEMGLPIELIIEEYNSQPFFEVSKGLEKEPEGGKRCEECFKLRLHKTGEYAKYGNFDFFTTSLSISPHKNHKLLNEIGYEFSKELGVDYLFSNFKKKSGYLRSCQLSKEHDLYRQDFCGCVFSKILAEENKT